MRVGGSLVFLGVLLIACGSSKKSDDGSQSSDGASSSGGSSNSGNIFGGHLGGSSTGGTGNHGGTGGGTNHIGPGSGGVPNGFGGNIGNPSGGVGVDVDAGDCAGTDCVSLCECGGGDPAECTATCASASSACTLNDGCAACRSDWGSCACNNYAALENCFFDPSIGLCPGADVAGECSSCTTNGTECLCELGSESECYDSFVGSGAWTTACASDGCSSCSCESCPTEQYLCAADTGCISVVNCMAANGCTDTGCAACANTVSNNGGIRGLSAGLAEALEACRGDSGCTACFP